MADKEKQTEPQQQAEAETKAAQETTESTETEEQLNPEQEGLKAAMEQAVKDASDWKDKYLRQAAEYDNYKKRTIKEKESLTAEVKAMTVKELLTVLDNLERAIGQTDDGGVKEGLVMLHKQCVDAFTKLGVTEIESENVTFDPTVHNAVMHIEDDALGENVITEVFQKGYRIGDKIIRHAMVKVAN